MITMVAGYTSHFGLSCDELTIVSSAGSPVFAGFITGLIMEMATTGLFIGGSLQLFRSRGWYLRCWCFSSTQLLVRFLQATFSISQE